MYKNPNAKPALFRALIVMAILGLASAYADASTTWHKELPGDKLTAKQGMKLSKDGKDVFKCRLNEMRDDRTRPSAVKGTKDTFHASVGDGLEDGAEGLADARLYKCQQVEFNRESGGFRKVD